MQRDNRDGGRPILTALFIDYDNIYQSLRRADEAAASRFAKDCGVWLKAIEAGRLISPTQGGPDTINRRLVMTRCYGNPMPRKTASQDKTDSNSFAFVRHHFLSAGFEMIDCLGTAQVTNSSDIRIVMDVRDYLTHDTYFDEFIILSGDADYTPVLHRLRAHARRTVIFASDNTAAQYKAIADGEVRETDLVHLLLSSAARVGGREAASAAVEVRPGPVAVPALPVAAHAPEPFTDPETALAEIMTAAAATVQDAGVPLPVEDLAEELQHQLGLELTEGTQWAGYGSLYALLAANMPPHIALTGTPPYMVHTVGLGAAIERLGHAVRDERPAAAPAARAAEPRPAPAAREMSPEAAVEAARAPAPRPAPVAQQPVRTVATQAEFVDEVLFDAPAPAPVPTPARAAAVAAPAPASAPAPAAAAPVQPRPAAARQAPPATSPAPRPQLADRSVTQIEQSIARIHDACQAPPLSPPDYRIVFDVMAAEIAASGLQGPETVAAIVARAAHQDLDLKPDDARFILDVVREADPWFEQGGSAPVFASRFRNYVVARCRGQGLQLSASEIDLIDAWFAASVVERRAQQRAAARAPQAAAPVAQARAAAAQERPALVSTRAADASDQWREPAAAAAAGRPHDEFGAMPRIVRSRVQA